MNVKKYHVENVDHSSNMAEIRDQIQSIEGVHAVRIDDVAHTITVEFENGVSESQIKSTINRYAR